MKKIICVFAVLIFVLQLFSVCASAEKGECFIDCGRPAYESIFRVRVNIENDSIRGMSTRLVFSGVEYVGASCPINGFTVDSEEFSDEEVSLIVYSENGKGLLFGKQTCADVFFKPTADKITVSAVGTVVTDMNFNSVSLSDAGIDAAVEKAAKNGKGLRELKVDGADFYPEFSSVQTEYFLSVGADTEKLDISAIPNNKGVGVDISDTALSFGENIITVKTSDGMTYFLYVNRAKDVKTRSSETLLKSLSVEGYPFDEDFDPAITDYSLSVGKGVTSVSVNAVPKDGNAHIVIDGADTLNTDENTVNVTVFAEDNVSSKQYRIHITKQSEEVKSEPSCIIWIVLGVAAVSVTVIAVLLIKNKKKIDR